MPSAPWSSSPSESNLHLLRFEPAILVGPTQSCRLEQQQLPVRRATTAGSARNNCRFARQQVLVRQLTSWETNRSSWRSGSLVMPPCTALGRATCRDRVCPYV